MLHSRVAKVLTFPPLTFTLFIVTPWSLYFTGWYPATLHSDYLHEMTHLHMVLIGCLFFWPLVGIDPVPNRVDYPFRVLLLALTLPFHAFLGITIMQQKDPDRRVAGTPSSTRDRWAPGCPRPTSTSSWPAGSSGAPATPSALLFFGVLFVQWVRSSMKEAEREDRRLDLLEARRRPVQPARPLAADGR